LIRVWGNVPGAVERGLQLTHGSSCAENERYDTDDSWDKPATRALGLLQHGSNLAAGAWAHETLKL
jgi:hypothetical protein